MAIFLLKFSRNNCASIGDKAPYSSAAPEIKIEERL